MSHFKQFIVLFLMFTPALFANEGPAPTESAKDTVEYSGRQDEEWMKMQTELGILKTKLDAEQAIVNELLVSKKAHNGPMSKDQIDQINQHHKQLTEQTKEYNKKLSEFELKYPEKGQALGRQYVRKKSLSLDEMENSLTLDGRIRKMNKKIKTQYKVLQEIESADKKMPKTDAEKKSEVKKSEKSKPTDVTEKIILVK